MAAAIFVVVSEDCERRRHGLPKILLILSPPQLFAIATIDIAQLFSNQGIRSFLSRFVPQGFHEWNQDLSWILAC
jgi:hypothetical protein